MAAPTITSVVYFDPWAPKPSIAGTAANLTVKVTGETSATPPLVARMLLDGQPWGDSTRGSYNHSIGIFPPGPLAAGASYEVQVQWVPSGQAISWTDAAAIAAAPVLSTTLQMISGEFDGTKLALAWSGGVGPAVPPGAFVQVVDNKGTARFFLTAAGGAGVVNVKPVAGATYSVYLRGVQPLAPNVDVDFVEPFTYGPVNAPLPIPIAGPVISSVTYDGAGLTAKWAPVAAPPKAVVADVGYTLHLLSGGQIVATFPAGSGGGRAAVGANLEGADVQVAARARFGPISGPLSHAPVAVLGAGPAIVQTKVARKTSETSVSVELPSLGTATATVDLLVNGAVTKSAAASGTPPVAKFDVTIAAGAHVQARARLTAAASQTANSGPPGPPSTALTDAPSIASAGYDGHVLSVRLKGVAPAGVRSYTADVTPNTGGALSLHMDTSLELAVVLDLAKTWKVKLQPFGENSAGPASSPVSVTLPAVVAPVVRHLAYDGATLTIDWTRATLPGLSGYTVTLAGGVAESWTTGPRGSLAVPLAIGAVLTGTTVTVTANSATRNTAASAAVTVPVPAPTTAVAAVGFDGANLVVGFDAAPPAAVTAAVFAGAPSGKGTGVVPTSAASSGTSASIAVDFSKFQATKQYTVALTYNPTSTAPVWGPPTPLIVAKPTVSGVACDGEQALVTVDAVGAPATGTIIRLLRGAAAIATATGGPTGGFVPIGRERPHATASPLTVVVLASAGNVSGPPGSAVPVLLDVPQLSAATLADDTIKGTAAVSGSPPIDTQKVNVAAYADGVATGKPISVAAGSFSLPVTAATPREWTLRTWLSGTKSGASIVGPLGAPHAVLDRPPRLLGASLADLTGDGDHWRLSASWDVGAYTDGCDVTLVQSAKTLVSLTRAQSPIDHLVPVKPPVARGSAPLTLTVAAHGSTGTGFAVGATFLAALVVVSAVCDGGVVKASWTAPTVVGHAPPSAYRLRLVRANGTDWETIASSVAYQTAAELSPAPVAGDPAEYGVAVDVGFEDSWSFAGSVTPLVRVAPAITSAVGTAAKGVTAATCKVVWSWPVSAPTSPAITAWSVVLVQDGEELAVGTAAATATSATVDIPASARAGARIGVRAIAGAASGPLSAATPVLVVAPVITRATALTGALAVEFHAPGAPVLDYTATLQATGTDVAHATVTASPATIALASPAKATKYEVSVAVASQDGVSVGPASEVVGALLVAPTLSAAAATAGSVSLTVVAPDAGGIATTSYDADLLLDGVVVASEPGLVPSGGAVSVAVRGSLDPRGAYAVSLQPVATAARGPIATVGVLLAAPVVASAAVGLVQAKLVAQVAVDASGLGASGLDGDAIARTDKGDSAVTKATNGIAAVPIPAGAKVCALLVRVRKGQATGPWSSPLAVPIAAPAVSKVAWDGRAVTLLWGAVTTPATVDRYRVAVRAAGVPVAGAIVDGTAATLPIALTGGSPDIVVTALAGPASGPPSDAIGVPLGAPAVAKVTTDPKSAVATVSWTAPTGTAPTGYVVQAYRDGRPAGAPGTTTTTSLALPAPVTVGADMEVAVAARWTSGETTLEGAYGQRQRVPTGVALLRDVDSDGLTVTARWDLVPGATGYALQVTADGLTAPVGKQQVGAAEGFARFAVDLSDTARTYSIVIQTLIGDSTGPASSRPLFEPGLYLTVQAGPPVVPILLRASSLPLASQAVTAYLPAMGTITGLPIAPAQTGATGKPFTLAANTAAASKTAFPYTLTIANGALEFDTARPSLAGTYSALLSAAEDGGATPAGIFAIQQAIARLMPQTLPETLFYAYGLTPDGSVDLRPGCVLRVAFSHWDQTGAPKSDWSTGYAGGPVVDYDVGDYVDDHGTWLVGFDAFLSWLAANSVLTVPAPQLPGTAAPVATGAGISESGAAEPADLLFADFRRSFHRLFFPDTLQPATPPATGRTGQQFAIAAAAKWKVVDASSPTPVAGTSVAYFRGRTVVKLCVRVTVDGAERVVPVGTTVGNLLDQAAARAPSAPIALRGLVVERATGPAVIDATAPYSAGSRERVRLDWHGLVTWSGGDALSLPVLHGDRITLGTR